MRRYPVANLGLFEAAPMPAAAAAVRMPFIMVPWTKLAFGVYGPYFDPAEPERGRFARLPPYAALVTPWGTAFPFRFQGWSNA